MPSIALREKCAIDGCSYPVERSYDGSYCSSCDDVFCRKHMMDDEYHDCNSCPEDEWLARRGNMFDEQLARFLGAIDVKALEERASSLRDGLKCSIPRDDDLLSALQYGGRNLHFPITFEDGRCWLARVRRVNKDTPVSPMREHVLLSEVATYEYLSSIGFPVPKVFDHAADADSSHGFGLPYILLEKVDGHPLASDVFQTCDEHTRAKILQQAAELQAKLADNPLPAVGSVHRPGSPVVGPVSYLDVGAELDTGPFDSASSYWHTLIDRMAEGIMDKTMYSLHSLDAYLAVLFFREQVHLLFADDTINDNGHFYLKHTDDKGDHIIVDDDFNIVGVVDWEGSIVVSKAEAFATPTWIAHGLFDLDLERTVDEKDFISILRLSGRTDLAACAEAGQPFWLLEQTMRCDVTQSRFEERYVPALLASLGKCQTWDEWKALALVRYADDPNLRSLSTSS